MRWTKNGTDTEANSVRVGDWSKYESAVGTFVAEVAGSRVWLTVSTSSIPSLTRPFSSSDITFRDGRRSSAAVAT